MTDLARSIREAFAEDGPFMLALGEKLSRSLPRDEAWHRVEIKVWAKRKGDEVLLDAPTLMIPEEAKP